MIDDFAVITCHFNPAAWRSVRRNYQRFLHEMAWWGVPTFAVEVAFPGQSFASDKSWLQIRGGWQNVMWQKERLLNLLVERLPEKYTKIAWVDADVLFLDPFWREKTCAALESFPLAQLWNKWHCVGPDGEIAEILTSVGFRASRYLAREVWSPGGAWAGRREVFPLYDRNIVGSGDAACLDGWAGTDHYRCLYQYTPAMTKHFLKWADDAYRKVQGNMTSMPFDMIHLYHGSRRDRKYIDRWKPVLEAGYDPERHVAVDENGLLAWTPEAPPELVAFVRGYFSSRREDDYTTPYHMVGRST